MLVTTQHDGSVERQQHFAAFDTGISKGARYEAVDCDSARIEEAAYRSQLFRIESKDHIESAQRRQCACRRFR